MTPSPSSPIFERGDHVELGRHLFERLGGRDGVVYEDGAFRCIDESGRWQIVDRYCVERMVHDYAGRLCWTTSRDGQATTTPIRLSAAGVSGIVRIAAVMATRAP